MGRENVKIFRIKPSGLDDGWWWLCAAETAQQASATWRDMFQDHISQIDIQGYKPVDANMMELPAPVKEKPKRKR